MLTNDSFDIYCSYAVVWIALCADKNIALWILDIYCSYAVVWISRKTNNCEIYSYFKANLIPYRPKINIV